MAARNRPRGGQLKEEFDEERSIWNSIKADGRRVDQLMTSCGPQRISQSTLIRELKNAEGFQAQEHDIPAQEKSRIWEDINTSGRRIDALMKESDALQDKILDLTAQQKARIDRGDEPSSRIDNELEQALRDNIRNLNEAQTLLQAVDGGNDISTQIGILSALRASPELSSASRATSVGGGKAGRERQGKRKLTDSIDDRESVAADSPGGPSPKVIISSQKDRLVAKSNSSRAGSVPAAREGSVKMDDDKDDLGKESRPRLSPQTEVLYRNNAKHRSSSSSASFEGEGILCRVTSVIGEGKQRRYEIIDADPDPPTPSVPYRASVNHLIPIPPPSTNTTLPDLHKGKNGRGLEGQEGGGGQG
ncbi:predicted protein [Plenodomus lingam JN3]|uniref:Predicted protein n=1 Tax=Leptosphaeria maculans (strain JN3 / isolate v23.1.3 / race Av1-4-5-6-7-8) TaxID=985895 RepID=E5A4Z3_LEPMJ|nr:predicted protein [Plenodomus lingam JN3]CBX98691.1 predicted protein [Plenodomus lingam JN3]